MSNIKDFVIENSVLKTYKGNDKDIVIPDEITHIDKFAFSWCQSIQSVRIPQGVTGIGEGAFFNCTNLITVVIPDTVKHFGYYIFEGCKNLTTIEFPSNIKNIPASTFARCESLMDFKIPDGVTEIEYNAFGGCTSLTSIKIPDGVMHIHDCAFSYCSSLKSITLPDSIISIGNEAFKYTYLSDIVLTKTKAEFSFSALEIIFNHFFKTENKLAIFFSFLRQLPLSVLNNQNISAKIKANKNKIMDYAFRAEDVDIIEKLLNLYKNIELDEINSYIERARASTNIEAFLLNYKNKKYSTDDQEKIENIKLEKELGLKKRTVSDWKKIYNFVVTGETIKITGYKGTESTIVIPDTIGKHKVVAVGKYAFSPQAPKLTTEQYKTREKITSVIIPEGVTTIFGYAFYGCVNLTSITIPNSVKSIGNEALPMHRNLTIHAPEGSLASTLKKK